MGDSKSKLQLRQPIAVLIADVHYNLTTLPLADAAMRMAIDKANSLEIPLIVAGDLHDTKANMRAECTNAMLETFATLHVDLNAYVLRGNHCAINEKSSEHALNFLRVANVHIVDSPGFYNDLNAFNGNSIYLIPYQHDPEVLKAYLKTIDKNSLLIMHQGVEESNMGDYVQDKSALPKECFRDFRVISGHYHARQDIKCGRPQKGAVGLYSYIGNPYTLTYGEAKDPAKGFQVLYSDGLMEFIPTNLRKHLVYELELGKPYGGSLTHDPGDLVWVKLKGTKEELAKLDKTAVAKKVALEGYNFRLDLIPLETATDLSQKEAKVVTNPERLDALIDSISNTSDERKTRLKKIWRDL